MTEIDVERARALTPGCTEVLHLNHAGASLLPQPVLDAVVGHLQLEARIGGYEAADAAAEAIGHAHDAVATLLGADPSDIALFGSSTAAWQAAVCAFRLSEGDAVVTTRAEYGANAIALLHLQHRTGCELVLVDDDEAGQVDLDGLAKALQRDRVAFVSLVHVPTQSGLVNPAAAVGHLCRDAGVPFVLDACQSAGQLPLDVTTLQCDVLTGNGRKFLRGPRGTGFLYVRPTLALEPRLLDLHGATWVAPDRYEIRADARRFETWEHDAAARIGLGVAVDHALSWGLDAIEARNAGLAAGLRERLAGLPRVTVRDRGERLCAITTFTVDGIEPADVAARLRAQRINVTTAIASAAQHDLPRRGLDAVVRASVHYVTTDEELDRFVDALSSVCGLAS